MKKCLRLAAVALALVCMAGMLAGCGNDPGAATKPEADKIVDEINNLMKISKTSNGVYNYQSGEIIDTFIHNNYQITEEDGLILSIIFDKESSEFAGVRLNQTKKNDSLDAYYNFTVACFKNIDTFGFENIDSVSFLGDQLKDGAKIGQYKISEKLTPTKGIAVLVPTYYNQLKFKN